MKILSTVFTVVLLMSAAAQASDFKQYQVTITNATAHHVFTPTLIVTHASRVTLFKVGEAASDGLAYQAENGDPSVILAETQGRAGVYDTVIGDFVMAGSSVSFTITAPKRAHLSLTAMLASTNDSFVALNNVELPKKSAQYYASIYDAGSEVNNEDCAFVPGPPCSAESGNARATVGSEGFVTISNGIHGHGDLSAQDLDWANPGAIVTISRLHK